MSEITPINPIKDRNNPRSVINIVPDAVARAMENVPDSLFELSEKELKKLIDPTLIHERLRVAFWAEYDRAQQAKKPMHMINVWSGVCTYAHWYAHILANTANLAYVLTPPPAYETTMLEALNFGLEQMREILALPHYDNKGKLNAKLADVKLKIVDLIIERVKGAVPHQIISRNLNVNVDEKSPQIEATDSTPKLEEIKERLALLEAQAEGTVINVQEREVKSTEES